MVRTHLQDIRAARRVRGRERFPAARKIYNSKRWASLRVKVLLRDLFCVRCRVELSSCVDHIIDIESGGDPWDMANLQGLCAECHGRKTAGV